MIDPSSTVSGSIERPTVAAGLDRVVGLIDTIGAKTAGRFGIEKECIDRAIPQLYGAALTSGVTVGRVAAQASGSASVCGQSQFLNQAIPFFLTAAGTFLVGAYALAQLVGGGGQALTMSSGKQSTFREMQMDSHKGFVSALVGLSFLGIMMGWMAFPVDTSCMPGI